MRHDHGFGSLIARYSLLTGTCLLVACSSDNNNGSSLSPGGSGNGTGAATGTGAQGTGASSTGGGTASGGTSGGTSTGGAVGTGGTVAACQGLPFNDTSGGGAAGASASGGAGGACNGVSVEAERIPVDLFMMMDRSISMNEAVPGGGTRWDALHTAVQKFVQSPSAADIGTGIGFFSKTGSTNDAVECNVSSYAQPVVGIGPLSTTGPSIVTAMDGITPGGLTPTVPALQGAIQYAGQWATSHPQRQAAVTLVTDGFPTECDNAPASIANAAAAGFKGTPSIRTYVIGVGKISRFNLQAFAQAGGTVDPYVVDDGDITQSFVTTLVNITGSKLACDYTIPPPTTDHWIDYNHIQIVYTPATGGAQELPYLTSAGACATSQNGGWYYDVDPSVGTPTTIHVCACSCANFGAGRVDVRVGCVPAVGPR